MFFSILNVYNYGILLIGAMQEASVETFSARPYQIELLDAAKKSNTIVCLGTGTGKTFISVMLIKEKQNEIKGTFEERGKRTFFLVCTGKAFLSVNQISLKIY